MFGLAGLEAAVWEDFPARTRRIERITPASFEEVSAGVGKAAGADVTGGMELTPVALAEGMSFARRQFGGLENTVDYDFIPTAVFCQPNIGTVGFTEEQALAEAADDPIDHPACRGVTGAQLSEGVSLKQSDDAADQGIQPGVVHVVIFHAHSFRCTAAHGQCEPACEQQCKGVGLQGERADL